MFETTGGSADRGTKAAKSVGQMILIKPGVKGEPTSTSSVMVLSGQTIAMRVSKNQNLVCVRLNTKRLGNQARIRKVNEKLLRYGRIK